MEIQRKETLSNAECELVQPFWRVIWQDLLKLKMHGSHTQISTFLSHVYMEVHWGMIYNSGTLQATYMLVNQRMAHTCSEIYCGDTE